jgi:hypothetical protein
MNLTVREAIAVLVILIFGEHLTAILNFFLSNGSYNKTEPNEYPGVLLL